MALHADGSNMPESQALKRLKPILMHDTKARALLRGGNYYNLAMAAVHVGNKDHPQQQAVIAHMLYRREDAAFTPLQPGSAVCLG